jgi:nucleoid-associated protein EbfC
MKQKHLMKQVMDMQKKMEEVQQKLDEMTIEASSGGDMVTVTMTGNHTMKAIKIDPELLKEDDLEMLQDLIVAAVNEAYQESSEMAKEEMAKITGGMNIPGMDLSQFGL